MIYYVKGLWWSLVGARRSTQTLQNTYATAVAVRMRPPNPFTWLHSCLLLASCTVLCRSCSPLCCCFCSSSYLLAWLISPSLCIFSSQMVEEAAAEQDTIEGADPTTATTTATPATDGKTNDLTTATAAKSSGSGSGSPRVLSVSDAVLWGAMRAQTELLRRKEPLMSTSTHAAAAAASDTAARRAEAEAYLATAGAARVEPRVTHAQMFFIVGVALVTMQVRNASFFRPNFLV